MSAPDAHSPRGLRRQSLRPQLLALLLAFGVIPLVVVVSAGYTVSRAALIDQAELALGELARRQSGYLETEIRRQRLLLRTITGQLATTAPALPPAALSRLLSGSLADDGVFDGLRLTDESGAVIADVALRETAPFWPAAEHDRHENTADPVRVHRDSSGVIAYILSLSVPLNDRTWRLDGHVRRADFVRLFDMPEHSMGGVELGVFDAAGEVILVPHAHAASGLSLLAGGATADSVELRRTAVSGTPSLAFTVPLDEVGWLLAGALPLDVVLAPIARLRTIAIVVGAGLVFLVVAAAHIAARFVTTPLRELAIAASELGQTGSYREIAHHGGAEMRALIDSFDGMATSLRQSRHQIDQLHAEEMERAQHLATVGELASGVAHEVRNPLTGVLGALELAMRRLPAGDQALPMLTEAQAQLRRIESTTGRLLEYARPPTLRELDVDLNSLIERAGRVVEAKAASDGVEFSVQPTQTALCVRADPELLVQVVVNLLLNALEAIDGDGTVTLWAESRDAKAVIGIRDTGPGIPEEHRDTIFRPFFTTKAQGTGLGLSISHQIITRHGGSLRTADTSEGGTTFVITLPRLADDGATT